MKISDRWYSERLGREVAISRWGEVGQPVLLFPTAGGDADEIERFKVIDALAHLLAEGRVKIYSCDSVAGMTMLRGDGTPEYRMRMLNQFQEYIRHEVVPAIRTDCRTADVEVIVAGSSIGAFNALAVLCRYPDVFSRALCMSGTYDLQRFLEAPMNPDFYHASPVHHVPGLGGTHLAKLRERFVLLASGEGRAEDVGESWRAAAILGNQGIPNRVDSWGPEWHHDWPTWRNMLVKYLAEMTAAPTAE